MAVHTGLLRAASLLLLIALHPALAADPADLDPIPSLYEEPGLSPNRDYFNQHATEHIDPFTGKLQLHYTDFFIPGNGGFDLKVERSYSSQQASFGPTEPSPYGAGWTMGFGRVLRSSINLLCHRGSPHRLNPVLELPNGNREILFDGIEQTGPVTFITPSRYRGVCPIGQPGMQVYAPDGTRFDFTVQGPVVGSPAKSQTPYYPSQIVDRNGNWMRFTYESHPLFLAVKTVDTSDGRTLTFAYKTIGNSTALDTISDNTGRTWTYKLREIPGRSGGFLFLDQVIRPDGLSWRYGYDETSDFQASDLNVTSMTYPSGGKLQYQYQFANFYFNRQEPFTSVVVEKKSDDGGVWRFAYRPGTRGFVPEDGALDDPESLDKTTVTGPNGTTTYWHFGYAGTAAELGWEPNLGRLLMKHVGAVQREWYSYTLQKISNQPYVVSDSIALIQIDVPLISRRQISRDGWLHETSYTSHDDYGNPLEVVEQHKDFRRVATLTYDIKTEPWLIRLLRREETDTIAGAVVRDFDDHGNATSEDRYGVRTEFTYHATGDVHTRTNARRKVSTFTDYKRGIPQTENHPEGVDLTRVVSGAGNVESETDAEGKRTSYDYDGLNRVKRVQRMLGNPIDIVWALKGGNLTRTLTRGAYSEVATFDGYQRAISMTLTDTASAKTITQEYRYNAAGQKTFQSFPDSTTEGVTLLRDELNRLREMTFGPGVSRKWDFADRVYFTNERGFRTAFNYRAYGDPDRRDLIGIDAPVPGSDLEIRRNGLGQVTDVIDVATQLTRTYGYDAHYFLTSISEPETGTTTLVPDEVGNTVSRQVGDAPATTFAYDDLDRLETITYPTGTPGVTRAYYKDSKLKSVDNGVALREYTYDDNKNLDTEALTVDALRFAINYDYDGNDALRTITYPSNRTVTYDPDAFGRPTRASPYATDVARHPTNEIKNFTYGNDALMELTLHPRRWPGRLTTKRSGTTLVDLEYGYDNVGNVTSITDRVPGSDSGRPLIQYDALNRLFSVSGPWGQGAIQLDGRGNIRSQRYGTSTLTYTYDATTERLASVSGAASYTFGYDAYGNVTSDGVNTFQYDDASNLRCSQCGLAGEVQHVYDGAGMRVASRQGGSTTYFVYALSGLLLAEKTESGVEKDTIYLDGRQIAQHGDAITYLYTDVAGSPIAAGGAAGEVLWREAYRPYGQRIKRQPQSQGQRAFFHGKAEDATGLQYFGARYYNPVLGRYYGVDPKAFTEGNLHSFNRYAYGNNNPFKYVDPNGEAPEDIFPKGPNGEPAPIVVLGRAVGALAAFVEGVATGNETLMNVALEGMRENQQILGETAIVLATLGRGGNSTRAALDAEIAAIARANAAQAQGAGRVAAGLTTAEGRTFVDVNSPSRTLHPQVQEAVNRVPEHLRPRFHGNCAELGCMSQALEAGASLKGASSAAVKIRKPSNPEHATRVAPCATCSHVMDEFGVKY